MTSQTSLTHQTDLISDVRYHWAADGRSLIDQIEADQHWLGDWQGGGCINGCHVPSCPPEGPSGQWGASVRWWCRLSPWYKDLQHRLGPSEQLEHSQPGLGWRDCRRETKLHGPFLCSFVLWGYFEARPFSSWIFLETLFWIRRLVWDPGAPSHQSEALLWKQVSKLHHVSWWR